LDELVNKASDPLIWPSCPEIRWHFIGHLQKNPMRAQPVCGGDWWTSATAGGPGLERLRQGPLRGASATQRLTGRMVQRSTPGGKETEYVLKHFRVTTGGPRSRGGEIRVLRNLSWQCPGVKLTSPDKHGLPPEDTVSTVQHILSHCAALDFLGLMTIGRYGYDLNLGPNPDFQTLLGSRQQLCDGLQIPLERVELSMGMSTDFDHAVSIAPHQHLEHKYQSKAR
ncbi:proline synthase co-transcribed bacterial homolog protein-like, partial [Notothenia coriiceps]|uniref:Proline synthase co-transcribed bacterial homolog protein-like n=1 Tax=Notothenia coriiceps TaxID=8208 RepID=A0A6I9NQK4_9TELE